MREVSESWFQAAVITHDKKLGIMLDPTVVHKDKDYREFGDMFFDRNIDPLEIDNKIMDSKYKEDISRLRGYYTKFKDNIPATGKNEKINMKLNAN